MSVTTGTRTPSDPQIAERLAAAVRFARSAGEITLRYFQTDRFETETKRDGSPVTTADREAEQHLRAEIAREFPSDAVLGEEFGEKPGTSGYRWILDPIDGTASFVCGVPLYGTLIGVERTDQFGTAVVAGVVHMPALDETVYAGLAGGAWHTVRGGDPKPARVSKVNELQHACACTTGFEYFAKAGRPDLFLALAPKVGKFRGWSDCYAHVLIATARIDIVIEPTVKIWDVAPAAIIMREAGGRFTDFAGTDSAASGDGLLTNGLVHDEMLALLAKK